MSRGLLPRLVLALLAALGLAGQSAMPVAHATAHWAESHAGLHVDGHHQLGRSEVDGPSTEIEGVDVDADHAALHAVVGVGPLTTVLLFVGTASVVPSAAALAVARTQLVAFAIFARPPGLSPPPAASRAPPIG